jgi:hypothetical protein
MSCVSEDVSARPSGDLMPLFEREDSCGGDKYAADDDPEPWPVVGHTPIDGQMLATENLPVLTA